MHYITTQGYALHHHDVILPQVFSPSLQCAASLMNITLRTVVLAMQDSTGTEGAMVGKETGDGSNKELDVRYIV